MRPPKVKKLCTPGLEDARWTENFEVMRFLPYGNAQDSHGLCLMSTNDL